MNEKIRAAYFYKGREYKLVRAKGEIQVFKAVDTERNFSVNYDTALVVHKASSEVIATIESEGGAEGSSSLEIS